MNFRSIRTMRYAALLPLILCLAMPALPTAAQTTGSVTFTAGGASVNGNDSAFREHQWQNDGFNGGIENLHIQAGEQLTIDGAAIYDANNYDLTLNYKFNDRFFIRAGLENQRKYFDSVGGTTPTGISADLNRDLELDYGSYFVEVGQRGEDIPEIVLGYECHYKDGDKSSLQWGTGSGFGIVPAAKHINETVHVVRLDFAHTVKGVEVRDQARYEKTDSETFMTEAGTGYQDRGDNEFHTLNNAISLEKWVNDSLFFGLGYLYSDTSGDLIFDHETSPGKDFWINGGLPTANATLGSGRFYTTTGSFDTDTNLVNFSLMATPIEHLTATADISAEYTQTGLDAYEVYDRGVSDGGAPPMFNLVTQSGTGPIITSLDHSKIEEKFELRYDGISHLQIYGQAAFIQESDDQKEFQFNDPVTGNAFVGSQRINRYTKGDTDQSRFRLGLTTAVIPACILNTYYQRTHVSQDFNHLLDEEGTVGLSGDNGYAGHMLNIDTDSDEFTTKLAWHPSSWFRGTVRYQYIQTDRSNVTDSAGASVPGGPADVMDQQFNVYSLKLDIVPNDRTFWSTTLAYTDSRMVIPSLSRAPANIDDYEGDVLSVFSSVRYTIDEKTSVDAGIDYSYAKNEQNTTAAPATGTHFCSVSPKVGVSHEFSDTLSGRIQYAYIDYQDSNYGLDAMDYSAHVVYCTMTLKF